MINTLTKPRGFFSRMAGDSSEENLSPNKINSTIKKLIA